MNNGFRALHEIEKQSDSYWVELAKLEFATELNKVLLDRGVNKSSLAQKLGTSKAYITKILRGDTNFSIESLVKLARAVDGRIHVHIADCEARVRWFDIHDGDEVKNKITNSWASSAKVDVRDVNIETINDDASIAA